MPNYRKRIYNKEKRALDFWILANAKKLKAIRFLGDVCDVCGDSRHYVLSFHHLDGEDKDEALSNMFRSNSWEKIEQELIKCILLCENCHRKEHCNIENSDEVKLRLLELKGGICNDCKSSKVFGAFDFHHRDVLEKDFKLSDVTAITPRVLQELEKCDLLCANCHRKEHFDSLKFSLYEERIIEKSYNLKRVRPPVDRAKILALHDEGIKQADIARELGCSISVVCQALKEHRNYYVKRIDDEVVASMYESGVNPYQIAKQLGFSRTTVVRSLKRTGTWNENSTRSN